MDSRRAALWNALLFVGIAGCASLGAREPSAEERFRQGLAAAAAQDFQTARTVFEYVYRAHWQEELGQRALLAFTAIELDPRNEQRRLWHAADLASRYLGISGTEPWTTPLAESFYLLAQELGAREEELARAEVARAQAEAHRDEVEQALRSAERGRELPTTTRESVPARLQRLAGQRDELQRRLQQTEQRLAAREKELRDALQELERIRQTIRK